VQWTVEVHNWQARSWCSLQCRTHFTVFVNWSIDLFLPCIAYAATAAITKSRSIVCDNEFIYIRKLFFIEGCLLQSYLAVIRSFIYFRLMVI
jgi:hypothetical protein